MATLDLAKCVSFDSTEEAVDYITQNNTESFNFVVEGDMFVGYFDSTENKGWGVYQQQYVANPQSVDLFYTIQGEEVAFDEIPSSIRKNILKAVADFSEEA